MASKKSADFDPNVVKHAHESGLASVSRLMCYSMASGLDRADDEIRERTRRQAIDDVIVCAISCRRIAEALGLRARVENLPISLSKPHLVAGQERGTRSGSIDLWKLMGIVVHSRYAEVIDDRVLFAMSFVADKLGYISSKRGTNSRWIEPLCKVQSDRSNCEFLSPIWPPNVRSYWRSREMKAPSMVFTLATTTICSLSVTNPWTTSPSSSQRATSKT